MGSKPPAELAVPDHDKGTGKNRDGGTVSSIEDVALPSFSSDETPPDSSRDGAMASAMSKPSKDVPTSEGDNIKKEEEEYTISRGATHQTWKEEEERTGPED